MVKEAESDVKRLVYVENSFIRAEIGNLWHASQMWLFWWRHVTRLIFS